MATSTRPIVHVRFRGRSAELPCEALGLDLSAADAEIKRAVAGYLDQPVHLFRDHVVVREHEAIILRPEAIYG